jgi:protoporphyrinogen/coproporphyrinogen III oxidase
MRIAIVGAGIAGLSIAWALRTRRPDVDLVVLDRRPRPGGNIRSERIDGYLCEWGPDGFLDNSPPTIQLARELGLGSCLQPSSDAARRRFIFRNGRLHEVPTSLSTLITTDLLSARGRARVACEPFARPRPKAEESIHEFAARRIGEEAADVLVASMVSGIFAGDARALSLQACFPRMSQLEQEHGSLVRAVIATAWRRRRRGQAIGAPAGRLTSFTGGMATLTDALAHALRGCVRLSSPALQLHKSSGRYSIASSTEVSGVDAIVLAGPASESARLVRSVDTDLADLLDGIPTAPLAVICLGYDASALSNCCGLKGFGFLVPEGEPVRTLGALWESQIYPNRAPDGKSLLRVMIGGACDPDVVALDDDRLLAIVREDLRATMGITIAPEFVRVVRHTRGIPQYVKGHVARMQQIEMRLRRHLGLYVAGNSYRGVSINSCIAEAGRIAETVLSDVERQSADSERQRPVSLNVA